MNNSNSSLNFFVLVFRLSIPFWILGAYIDLKGIIPINLPISALMLLCPMAAAIILTWKKDSIRGVILLLKCIFDFKKIQNRIWYLPFLLLIPTIMLLAFGVMHALQIPIPKQNMPLIDAVLLFLLFFISAIGEEVGWTGYVTDPLQNRFGTLKAALIIGTIWAIWHIIPFMQAHRTPIWIFWQCVGTIALRIIIVWLYNNTHKSLFAAILCHATINMSVYGFPNYGSHYDPFYFGIILILIASIISFQGLTKKNAWKIRNNKKYIEKRSPQYFDHFKP